MALLLVAVWNRTDSYALLSLSLLSLSADDQWLAMTETFERWPFRPEYLFAEGRVQPDTKKRDN